MPAYPSFVQGLGSTILLEDEILSERASNGALRSRVMWSESKGSIALEHVLNADEVATLRTFYADNRGGLIDVVFAGDGVMYQCLMVTPPSIQPLGGGFWSASVGMPLA